jgi:type I restriction enzyme S subunit
MSSKLKTTEKLLEKALVSEEEQQYEVPENWLWVKSEFVAKWGSGGTPSRNKSEYYNGKIPWLKTGELKDTVIFDSEEKITEEGLKNSSAKLFPKDSVAIAMYGATIGKLGILGIDAATNQACAVGVPSALTNKNFMFYYFLSQRKDLIEKGKGGAQPNISQTIIKEFPFVLPPLNEQKRIADKVERLLGKIEEAKQLIKEVKDTFELRRAAILDKAFRGKLTSQWRDENNGIDIFEVQYHLTNLRNSKESSPIKSNTLNIKPVNLDDEPFELPRGWKWVRLGELSYYVTSGSRDWSKYYADNGSYFIRTQDINKNKLNLENVAHVLLPEKVEGKRSLVEPFDLLTTITGANVGKCAVVEETIPEAYVSQSVALTKLIDKSMAKYVHLSLLSTSGGGGELENRAYGIGRPVLSLEDIKNIRLPIAPYKERQIIVDLVKNLLDKEDKTGSILMLEEKLDQLEQSILSKAFRGELGTNDPSEESAIEMLKDVLQEHVK